MWDFYTANARYLCPIGGNAEFNVLVFPASGEPTAIIQMPTFVEGWRSAQDWVADMRPRSKTWADSVAMRLKELRARRRHASAWTATPARSIPDGWVPHNVHTRLIELMPNASIVALDDMLEKIRAIKSAEELEVLRKAARLGDLMLATCRDTARPGVKECEVYADMMQAMIANGGEEPTLFLWACDRYPIRIRSACRPRGRWSAATSSSARCIRNTAAISPTWSARSVSASRTGNRSRSTRAASRPTSAGSKASAPAGRSRPRWRR